MKLKAPPGVGEPCVAGVSIAARDGLYDVEAETGALLIACFGFVEVEAPAEPKAANAPSATPRRRAPAKKA
jgi:hypothetical protein